MLTSAGLGIIVGVILALTGAGGGILAVPLLLFGVGLSVAEAGPIGLLAVGIAASLGAAFGLKTGIVRYRAALFMAGAGALLSPIGVWLARRIDNQTLGIVFAIVLLFVAFKTFLQVRDQAGGEDTLHCKSPPCIRDAGSGRFVWTTPCARALALAGAVAGLLSGLLGVGGGFVMVPALRRYTDLSMQSIVATSLTVTAMLSIAGVAPIALAGHLNWNVALPFSAGALTGMLGGRLLSSRLAGPQLQQGFAALSAAVAVVMIARSVL